MSTVRAPDAEIAREDDASLVPLVVDLDGTLLRTDLLHESALTLLRVSPLHALLLPVWLTRGKAYMKRRISEIVSVDVTVMPYHEDFLAWVRGEREKGRRIVLATASDATLAHSVAHHLGLFDETLASDGHINNASHRKAKSLIERFGERGFDYAGNARPDLAVWQHARRAIVVGASPQLVRAAAARAPIDRQFPAQRGGLVAWIKALRLHQWLKNFLLFLPLLGAHQLLVASSTAPVLLAFLSFGLCASSVYIVNDLIDLDSDRHHPRKRLRPFAQGLLSPIVGVNAAFTLLCAAFALAVPIGPSFARWLGIYFLITVAYTFWLKRKEIVDALSLAALYTLRILAGGAAAGLGASFWLLAFSLFLFLSLAFVKRVSELQLVQTQGLDAAKGRGYRTSDLPLIEMMGVVSGFSSVVVLALYINSDTVIVMYKHPQMMWLTVPLLLYWTTRIWIKTHRALMHDDPVLFAVKDRVSLACGALFLVVLWLAT